MKINQKEMLKYFENFDSLSHKFLNNLGGEDRKELLEKIIQCFYSRHQRSMGGKEAMEIVRTMEKVYHYSDEQNIKIANLLEQTGEKFLEQYVNIDGMHELFRSSFFYFEWMMHLEYMQDKHDYSYYRDHYLHQIRNLYEMFLFLENAGLWVDCMEIYRQRGNLAANLMADSVREQLRLWKGGERFEILEQCPFSSPEEWCYHYIIFSTAIVSSLVHDIGYPIAYMKRNLNKLQDFLPMSNLFMGLENGVPRIKSLLSGSLLFQTVDNGEIIRRLDQDDHGTYSAVALLCQYYDNGKIFSLEPTQRMIIELSALVIYNHTLHYAFQNRKNFDRYQNVFTDNPIAYLFRLCDDMQEWERVYFQITEKSSFFICDKCKAPMIRRKNKPHKQDAVPDKMYVYACACNGFRHVSGINTVWFPYRRLINVAPFTELIVETLKDKISKEDEKVSQKSGTTVTSEVRGGEGREKGGNVIPREREKWTLELKCDKKALLQLARYNSLFAIQRINGIRELRGMVYEQVKFPQVFVKAFISNNPVTVKTEILKDFVKKCPELHKALYVTDEIKKLPLKDKCGEIIVEIKKHIVGGNWGERIYRSFCEKNRQMEGTVGEKQNREQGINGLRWDECEKNVVDRMQDSINFYLFLAIFTARIYEEELDFAVEKVEEYEVKLNEYMEELAKETASRWEVTNTIMVDLITDCFVCMYGNLSAETFFEDKENLRSKVRIPLRRDICDLLKKYTCEEDYEEQGIKYDYYSDYFFYFSMDCMTEAVCQDGLLQ